MKLISATAATLLTLTISALSQDGKDRDNVALVLNFEKAPLELISKGYTLSVKNRSTATIASYRLGCAHFVGDHLKITHRWKMKNKEMAPGTAEVSFSFDLLPDELITCQDLKSSLIPLEAVYKNGKSWSLLRGPIKAE